MRGFGFDTLALLAVLGMAGPLLAAAPGLRIPVVIGELVAGIIFGRTGFRIVDHTDSTLILLANIGFALVMFVVGTHVPVRDTTLRSAVPSLAGLPAARRPTMPFRTELNPPGTGRGECGAVRPAQWYQTHVEDGSADEGTAPIRVSGFSRRTLIATGAATAIAGAGVGLGGAAILNPHRPGPALWQRPERTGAQPVGGLHLQFGSSAASEVVVSWFTTEAVGNPRIMLGSPDGGFGRSISAQTRTYRDAQSAIEVRVNHAQITDLTPDTDYVYAAVHDGATPELGTFRTAPAGRSAFSFTSFGDQGTPTLGKLVHGRYTSDNVGTPAAGDITTAIERVGPLFNLVNGDLCYANMATDRIRTWSDWFDSNSRSARYRPWMPATGNHENELGNGPTGFGAYQAYFMLPDAKSDEETRGLWYAFTAGAVRVISLSNDDVCYQDGGDFYVRGYSGGAQQRWLEQELINARNDGDIDWVVVCMHQTAISTANNFNGADLGIRQTWVPLFDHYGVDLVVCGHEHHYERSHPIRGAEPIDIRTPIPVATDTKVIDTSKGTVHLVIGGGGTSLTSNGLLFEPPRCRVLTAVGAFDPPIGHKASIYVEEDAPWSAFRDRRNPYGFVAFDVDPGVAGENTSIHATYYAVHGPFGAMTPVDQFTLTKRGPG